MNALPSDPVPSNWGVLGRLIGDAGQARARLDRLTEQASSGRVADTYAGLGAAGARTSLDLRPQLGHVAAAQAGIDAASGRMDVSQTALKAIAAVADQFRAKAASLSGTNAGSVALVAADARSALQQVAGLLNTRNGDAYVFAGTDSANPPVPGDILASGMVSGIAAAVSGLANGDAAAVIAATRSAAASDAPGVTPFSAALLSGAAARPTIEAEGAPVPVGLLANANAAAVSAGPSTTGSAVRDLLRGLATLAGLGDAQAGAAGFDALVRDANATLADASGALATDAGVLGDTQNRLADTRARLGDTATALTKQVSGVEDADMASTLSELSAVQTRLQASYKLIAGEKAMSLADYL